ncbi:hypothetical protein [Rugamonas rivuli]|uniref:Uncharacterized protein n=1 Tax=Rugamonas rivuli TaxID=2743358 RepID=A0A843SLB9_9BURK|nr:hypothetical protein [Rugamonas rivuli]MQA22714.1 hypothetical protein [Rugamonas rivuli]
MMKIVPDRNQDLYLNFTLELVLIMRILDAKDIAAVAGGAYGVDQTMCPPGYGVATTTSSSSAVLKPNASGSVGMDGNVPKGSVTLSPGTTTTTYTVTTACVPNIQPPPPPPPPPPAPVVVVVVVNNGGGGPDEKPSYGGGHEPGQGTHPEEEDGG